MAQKTVITKVNEAGEEVGIRLHFPQNRVLYVDQFTGYSPDTADERAVFCPSTIDDVFTHYSPVIEGIALLDEEGDISYESFRFESVNDFDDDRIIAQSEVLSNGVYKMETYYSIIRYLERNRNLRRLMSDPEAKSALKSALKAIRRELPSTKTV